MNDINQDITRMIVEMRELGKLPAPCKGGSHNNLLRYNSCGTGFLINSCPHLMRDIG